MPYSVTWLFYTHERKVCGMHACARSNKSFSWRMYVIFYCFKDSTFHSKISSNVSLSPSIYFGYNENKVLYPGTRPQISHWPRRPLPVPFEVLPWCRQTSINVMVCLTMCWPWCLWGNWVLFINGLSGPLNLKNKIWGLRGTNIIPTNVFVRSRLWIWRLPSVTFDIFWVCERAFFKLADLCSKARPRFDIPL